MIMERTDMESFQNKNNDNSNGFGSVVASDTRGPQFESNHRENSLKNNIEIIFKRRK